MRSCRSCEIGQCSGGYEIVPGSLSTATGERPAWGGVKIWKSRGHRHRPAQSLQPHRLIHQFRKCNVPTAAYLHEVIKTDHLEDIPALGIPVLANSPFTAARLKERCAIESNVLLPLIEPRFYKTRTRRRRVL